MSTESETIVSGDEITIDSSDNLITENQTVKMVVEDLKEFEYFGIKFPIYFQYIIFTAYYIF